jgi:hypothetical protein
MDRRLQLLALLSLAIVPAGSSAIAASVSLASASRMCTGETRVRIVSNLLQPNSVGQEQASPMGETVSARRVGDQFEIRRSFSMPGGEAILIAHIRPDGTVIDADMSANMPGVGSDQIRHMSSLAARTLPERLVLGREFRPGDNLYADLDPQELVANIVGAMAVPPGFQFQFSGSLPFAGMIGDGAGRALNFAGDIRATGSGQANGHTMTMAFPARITMMIDAASGLMRSLLTEGTMEMKLDGVTQMQMHLRQDLTCTITPAA